MLSRMQPGGVIIDVAVDQGGSVETCRPTSHEHPTYTVDGIIHYAVPNMPGAVPRTSTYALTNVTLEVRSPDRQHGLERSRHQGRSAPQGRQHPQWQGRVQAGR